jgi:hypothetical protein
MILFADLMQEGVSFGWLVVDEYVSKAKLVAQVQITNPRVYFYFLILVNDCNELRELSFFFIDLKLEVFLGLGYAACSTYLDGELRLGEVKLVFVDLVTVPHY